MIMPFRSFFKFVNPGRIRRTGQSGLLTRSGAIKLSWAGSSIETNRLANLGDSLSAYIISSLACRPIERTGFDENTNRLLGVGSIGHVAKNGTAVIWGSGCYRPELLQENARTVRFEVLATRGALSHGYLKAAGIASPACYGEPVWLLPSIVNEPVEKKYELGLISHISDLRSPAVDAEFKADWTGFTIPSELKRSVRFIHTWHTPNLQGILNKLREIRSCKRIASRSFHGLVIAEAYGIPCIPVCSNPRVPQKAFSIQEVDSELLDKRVRDYFSSVRKGGEFFHGLRRCKPVNWEGLINRIDALWRPVEYDAAPMLEAFPFEIPSDPLTTSIPTHLSMETQIF